MKAAMNRRVLSDLVPIRHAGDFLREVLSLCGLDECKPEGAVVANAYHLAFRLYRGECCAYLKCDTPYHDFTHAAETFLAMARLLQGARIASENFESRDVAVGLTAAILHDSGYIPMDGKTQGRGALYASEHERRSMAFVSRHGEEIGLSDREIDDCRTMIRGTMMAQDVNALSFRCRTLELLVRMLSVADLLAQLSSATYLERLLFLYEEDRDAPAPHYRNPLDCYQKAIVFDERARVRLQRHLEPLEVYLTEHFADRWNTPDNLYRIAMERQIHFLTGLLGRNRFDPRRHLRRWGSLQASQRLMSESAFS